MCNTLVYKWLYFTWSINNAALARAAVSLAGKHTIYERPEYTIESLTNEKHQQQNILLAGAMNLNEISLDLFHCGAFHIAAPVAFVRFLQILNWHQSNSRRLTIRLRLG